MKKIISLLTALIVLVCAASCGYSKTETQNPTPAKTSDLENVTSRGKMLIGVTESAPLNFKDADGNWQGFNIEFASLVCERLGVQPEFVEINLDSKEIELNSKNIDCIWNGLTITPEREANMELTVPYMTSYQVIIVRPDDIEKYTKNADNARVIAEAGSYEEDTVKNDSFFEKAQYTSTLSLPEALNAVQSGTADIALIDYTSSVGCIGENTSYPELRRVEGVSFSPAEYGVAFRKGSDIAVKVNSLIAELNNEGKLLEIAQKYGLTDNLMY